MTTTKTSQTPFILYTMVSDMIAKDRAYRNAQAVRDLPPHLLQDVGLTDTPHGLRR